MNQSVMFLSSAGTSGKLELQQEDPQWDADIRYRRGPGEAFGCLGRREAEAFPAHEGVCYFLPLLVRFHPVLVGFVRWPSKVENGSKFLK